MNLPYTQIIVYQRVGDEVRPCRRACYWHNGGWAVSCTPVPWSDLYSGHTTWIHNDVLAREARYRRAS